MRAALLAAGLATAAACGSAAAQPRPDPTRPDPGSEPGPSAARRTTFRGPASYYADFFDGRETANGELYDPAQLTAASRTLPFQTRLRCTRVDNGLVVEVRINDRGPFGRARRGRPRRILDFSRAAAEQLDMIERGVVTVRCTVLEWGPPRRRSARHRRRALSR